MLNAANNAIANFFRMESSSGILLMVAAVLALVMANSPLAPYYALFIDTPVQVQIGALEIAKPLLLWINDGLMAVFFFLVGLELKRELLEGELSSMRKVVLPGFGAVGGMLIPATVYLLINAGDPQATSGWAIPAATDIAFALGILALLGSRVPISVKVFLTSLAIFDDIGAIVIIAVFYTDQISLLSLLIAGSCIPLLALFNRRGVEARSVYIAIGLVMWVSMLKSGVHATLTGVILAIFIPMRSAADPDYSPLREWEHDLHVVVAFFTLPLFAFVNAGISLQGVGLDQLTHGVPMGIALGLFVGKQLGVFGMCWLAIRLRLADMPEGMSWLSLYGTAILCGVGFTMSLFIGSLAFESTGVDRIFDERLGIIIGSLLSGVVGYLVLRRALLHAGSQPPQQGG
ncbi:MAG: Na(+)/H(+) antiporter NhaA [Gammaproteobacteria bacterium RIFCSPLOWO2_02_FULL_57_10]|nr:MAG: Na(+)/H(+) antiporter NhaA [Gammaproteobacteria bacterium RIFCSPLOWO2_02_FULL_57_10]